MITTEMYRDTLPVTVVFMLWLSLGSSSRSQVQVDVGDTALLSCIVDITGSNIVVEWYNELNERLTQNEEVLTQDKRFTINRPYIKEWVLSLSYARNSDAGRYECRIGPIATRSNFVELVVSKPPVITHTSGNGSYLLNSRVNLSCVARGIPEPEISWLRLKNHQLIGLNVKGNNYLIDSVNLSTAGVYECHAAARGVKQVATAAFEVHVLFAPIIKVPYQEVIQEVGKWTQLSCLVTVNPKVDLYWTRNSRRVDNSGSYVVSSQEIGRYQYLLRLSIEILSYSDFGEYQCFAENKYGTDSGQITLSGEQKKKAVVVSKPRDLVVTVGEDALFNCSVLHLPTDDRLTWWHRSANETRKLFEFPSLKDSSSKKTSEVTVNSLEKAKHDFVGQYNLLIRRANFSDEGLYTCQITGHENLSATLNVIASKDSDTICEEYHQEAFNLNTILIILGLVVIALLLATIIIILVCRHRARRYRKDLEYSHPVQLNAKVVVIDQ